MRVLLVHQAYADNRQPGGVRHFELARRLTAVGHEVTIITGEHCYLSGKPLRRPYRERYQGIEVVRVPTWPTLGSGLIGKVASYVSFMLSALWAGMRCGAHDVVMGTSPPIFQVAPAWIVAALRRCPFVLEVRDLWPAFAVDMGVLRNRLVIRFAERVERFFYARASRIIVNSPAYIDYLKGLGIEPCKLSNITHGSSAISI